MDDLLEELIRTHLNKDCKLVSEEALGICSGRVFRFLSSRSTTWYQLLGEGDGNKPCGLQAT